MSKGYLIQHKLICTLYYLLMTVPAVIIDNIKVGGLPYEEIKPFTVSSVTQKESMTWKAWEDDENTETDSFTVTNAVEESRGQGSNPVMFSYNCPGRFVWRAGEGNNP